MSDLQEQNKKLRRDEVFRRVYDAIQPEQEEIRAEMNEKLATEN